jgi:hypothetical protein
MPKLNLEIETSDSWEFFQEYDKLTPLQQKILMLTIWWAKKFPTANPKQETIAKKAACSRKYVNEMFRRFEKLGWLWLESRGTYRPKILVIPSHILQMDVYQRKYFKRTEVTASVTLNISSTKKKTGEEKNGGLTSPIQIPSHLQGLKISFDSQLKLSLVPEHIYQEALYSCKVHQKNGKTFDNPESYLVGAALRIARSKQLYINWHSYYKTIEKWKL